MTDLTKRMIKMFNIGSYEARYVSDDINNKMLKIFFNYLFKMFKEIGL